MHKRGRSAQLTPLSGLAPPAPSPCFLFLFSFLYFFYSYSYSFFLVISSALPFSRFEVCLLYANAFICSQFGAHPCRSSAYLLLPFFSTPSCLALSLSLLSLALLFGCSSFHYLPPDAAAAAAVPAAGSILFCCFSLFFHPPPLFLCLSILFGQAIRCCLGSVCARQLVHRRLRSVSST